MALRQLRRQRRNDVVPADDAGERRPQIMPTVVPFKGAGAGCRCSRATGATNL